MSSSPLPTYADLGKGARDLFTKGYHFGLYKLNVKSKTSSGLEFTSDGTSNIETGNVFGSVESKFKCTPHGVTITEKWNTDNTLSLILDVQNKLTKGLKLSMDTSFAPESGIKQCKVKSDFTNDFVHGTADIDLKLRNILNASAVFGHNGFLLGYESAFDVSKIALVKNNIGLGYAAGDLVVHANINDGETFGCSVFQKPHDALEIGMNLGWSLSSHVTSLGFGCKYRLDKNAIIRAKINNALNVGFSYEHTIRPGISLTVSSLFDCKNGLNQGGHKFGMGLELES